MKKSAIISTIAAMAASISAFTGCTTSDSGNVFSRQEALAAHEVILGTIVDVREGKLEGENATAGAVAGGVMGGLVGNLVGGGRGNNIATAGGAILGAAGGAAAAKAMSAQAAYQLTVKLDDSGKTVTIVQAKEKNIAFYPGQRVRIITRQGGRDRVQPL